MGSGKIYFYSAEFVFYWKGSSQVWLLQIVIVSLSKTHPACLNVMCEWLKRMIVTVVSWCRSSSFFPSTPNSGELTGWTTADPDDTAAARCLATESVEPGLIAIVTSTGEAAQRIEDISALDHQVNATRGNCWSTFFTNLLTLLLGFCNAHMVTSCNTKYITQNKLCVTFTFQLLKLAKPAKREIFHFWFDAYQFHGWFHWYKYWRSFTHCHYFVLAGSVQYFLKPNALYKIK